MFTITLNHFQALKLKHLLIKLYTIILYLISCKEQFVNALILFHQYNQLIWKKLNGSGLRILLKTVNLECSI